MTFEEHLILFNEVNQEYHDYYESTLLAKQSIERIKIWRKKSSLRRQASSEQRLNIKDFHFIGGL